MLILLAILAILVFLVAPLYFWRNLNGAAESAAQTRGAQQMWREEQAEIGRRKLREARGETVDGGSTDDDPTPPAPRLGAPDPRLR